MISKLPCLLFVSYEDCFMESGIESKFNPLLFIDMFNISLSILDQIII